jgi:ectoine hydroxylase-related dioxygenase (phytanoyl-CoA dioxygenase family)
MAMLLLPADDQSAVEQKEFFDTHGFVVVRGCLSAAEVEECAAAVTELHERAAAGESGSFQYEPFARGALTEDRLPVLRKIERTDDLSPVFHRLARHPKIVATWQNVIGDENLLLFRSTLMLKPAHHGSAHALHQDAAVRRPSLLWSVRSGPADGMHATLCATTVLAAAPRRLGSRCFRRATRRGLFQWMVCPRA